MTTSTVSRNSVNAGRETAEMRDSITNSILNWADGANWADDQNAERVFQKLAEAPERFVSPNPSADYHEEASRIYHKIKAEHGLRTVSEAADEADDYDDRAKRHAVEALRDRGHDVAEDVADEFGRDFVNGVLEAEGYEPLTTTDEDEISASEVETTETTETVTTTDSPVTADASSPTVMCDGGWVPDETADADDQYDDWSDGQRGIGGSKARGQSTFGSNPQGQGGEDTPSDDSNRVESIPEYNDGGLLADTRETAAKDIDDEPPETTQATLGGGRR